MTRDFGGCSKLSIQAHKQKSQHTVSVVYSIVQYWQPLFQQWGCWKTSILLHLVFHMMRYMISCENQKESNKHKIKSWLLSYFLTAGQSDRQFWKVTVRHRKNVASEFSDKDLSRRWLLQPNKAVILTKNTSHLFSPSTCRSCLNHIVVTLLNRFIFQQVSGEEVATNTYIVVQNWRIFVEVYTSTLNLSPSTLYWCYVSS